MLKACPQAARLTVGQIKAVGRFGRPQPHGIDSGVLVAWNGVVVGHSHDHLGAFPAFIYFHTTIEMDGNGVLRTRELPAVAKSQPVIRNFPLIRRERGVGEGGGDGGRDREGGTGRERQRGRE